MRASLVLIAAFAAGCASARAPVLPTRIDDPAPAALAGNDSGVGAGCAECGASTVDLALINRSTERVAELKNRGGECATYGSVLETSLNAGRVTVRPYMWRVEGRLVSGEARSDGAIAVARHIDPLNVGVRTIEDMVWTLEHEAAHVAFRISNGRDAVDDRANALVRGCR